MIQEKQKLQGIGAYVNKSCNLPKKKIFDSLHKHFRGVFSKITKKGNFDGLHKQIM